MIWCALPSLLFALVGVSLAIFSIELGFPFLVWLIGAAEVLLIPSLFFVMRALADIEAASERRDSQYAMQRELAPAAGERAATLGRPTPVSSLPAANARANPAIRRRHPLNREGDRRAA